MMEKLIGKIIMLLIVMSLMPLNSTMADETGNWAATINDYISTMITWACIEKTSPELKECRIPPDKCKRFVSLVAKSCLGEQVALQHPVKHARNMKEEELLAILEKASVCTGRRVLIVTYYLCPEQHERKWAGTGGYK
jgi:hypothetical protein